MKILTLLLALFSGPILSCVDTSGAELRPFAFAIKEYPEVKKTVFQINVPSKLNGYNLTLTQLTFDDIVTTKISTSKSEELSKYHTAYFVLNPSYIDKVKVTVQHSQRDDGAYLGCSESVDYMLSTLLSEKPSADMN